MSDQIADVFKKQFSSLDPEVEPWGNQEEALERVSNELKKPNVDVIALNGPVASGKSLLNTAIGKSLKDGNANVVYCTPVNSLVDQINEDGFISDNYTVIRGKSNYPCNVAQSNRTIELENGREVGITPEEEWAHRSPSQRYKNFAHQAYGPCCNWKKIDETEFGNFEDACPYGQAMYRVDRILSDQETKFEDANIILTTLDMYLRSVIFEKDYREDKPREIDLLIIDEADQLEEKAFDIATVDIGETLMTFSNLELPDCSGMTEMETKRELHSWLEDRAVPTAENVAEKLDKGNEELSISDMETMEKVTQLKSALDTINTIGLDNMMLSESEEGFYRLEPIRLGGFLRRKLLNNVDFTILSSGTINSHYIESLDLDKGAGDLETAYVPVQDRRPEDRKKVYVHPTATMSGNKSENTPSGIDPEELEKMTNKIKEILDEFEDDKGIIHCKSYGFAKHLKDELHLTHPNRVLLQDREDREDSIEEFKNSDDPKVFLSVNNRRGLNLKDDLARFNLIPRVPYPVPTKRSRLRDQKWYFNRAVREISQAVGRTTRTPEDWSATIILDDRFNYLMKSNRGLFPSWFNVENVDSIEEVSESVEKFREEKVTQ